MTETYFSQDFHSGVLQFDKGGESAAGPNPRQNGSSLLALSKRM